ncbi:MAG TPA: hypothetical protein VFW48_11760 [Solirubrobacterales bacterium]|nr:hypothetical protein [Solirubrobacterales bacterium]
MRLGQAATLGVLLSLALVLIACGDESTSGSGRATAAPGEAGPVARSSDARCRAQLRPFLDSMDSLREDLAVGLSYEDYLDELREAREAYGRIRADRLPVGCLLVAAGAGERALNRYIDAANVWGDCLATAACETEAIEPRLQRRWALASDLLTSARSGL